MMKIQAPPQTPKTRSLSKRLQQVEINNSKKNKITEAEVYKLNLKFINVRKSSENSFAPKCRKMESMHLNCIDVNLPFRMFFQFIENRSFAIFKDQMQLSFSSKYFDQID